MLVHGFHRVALVASADYEAEVSPLPFSAAEWIFNTVMAKVMRADRQKKGADAARDAEGTCTRWNPILWGRHWEWGWGQDHAQDLDATIDLETELQFARQKHFAQKRAAKSESQLPE